MGDAPERIWLDWPGANRGEPVYDEPPERDTQPGQTGYVRADIHAAVVAERDALREKLTEWETKLSTVMPHDFKDWHRNNPDEWPEIAAMVIKNLREQLELTEPQLDACLNGV
jgi:hypothetical protein